jgi:hypothetical protein
MMYPRVSLVEQISLDKSASRRTVHRLARLLAIALVVFGCVFSAPAVACLCNCSVFSTPEKYPAATQPRPAEYYDQVFSGLVLSTERTREPVVDPPVSFGNGLMEDPGYWIKSRVLVLRIWRGTPSTVAEVWTPIVTNCDVPPFTGFHFVALVKTEKGRSVAPNTYCDCVEKDAATEGPGAFAVKGIAIAAASLGASGISLLSLVKGFRRRRRSG